MSELNDAHGHMLTKLCDANCLPGLLNIMSSWIVLKVPPDWLGCVLGQGFMIVSL